MLAGRKKIRAIFIANALFVASLALPASIWDDYPTDHCMFRIEILLKGWAGPLAGDFAWYANPLFLYVSHSVWRHKNIRARWLLAILLLLASTFVLIPALHSYSWFLSQSKVILIGSYTWGCSMLFAAIAAVVAPNNSFKPTPLRGAP